MNENPVKPKQSNPLLRWFVRIVCIIEIFTLLNIGSTGIFILSLMPIFAFFGLIASFIRSPTWLLWIAAIFAFVPIVVGLGIPFLLVLMFSTSW